MSRIRGADGRFVRPGGKVPTDTGSPSAAVLVPESDEGGDDVSWGVRSVSAGFAVDLNAGALVDAMSRALLDHHRTALATGQRPDGGGPQKPLGRRALADPDRESANRGYNTGEFADEMRRTEIKSDGRTASCRILPPPSRNAYVGKEAARGVVLLTGAGAAGEAAAAAARAAVAVMVDGRSLESTPAAVTAKNAEP